MAVFKKTLVAFGIVGMIGAAAGPALANRHMIDSQSTKQIEINACGSFKLKAIGDGTSDLDFRMIDEAGRTIFTDLDASDMTAQVVPVSSCAHFTLYVENVGYVWNELDLELVYVD